MKILRFVEKKDISFKIRYGMKKGETIAELNQFPFSSPSESDFTKNEYHLDEIKIISPVSPSKIVAVGLNYKDHARELDMAIPDEPVIFIKPSTTVIGPGEEIILPSQSQNVHYEAELGIVISKKAKDVSEDEASDYILGYTILNDVTARDLQEKDGQWTRSKSFDTFCPLGPWIETEIDPGNVNISLRLNGELKQSSNTKNLIFSVGKVVSFISQIMTLNPGDVIATGTPPGVGRVKTGDIVEIEIENIGILKNTVK